MRSWPNKLCGFVLPVVGPESNVPGCIVGCPESNVPGCIVGGPESNVPGWPRVKCTWLHACTTCLQRRSTVITLPSFCLRWERDERKAVDKSWPGREERSRWWMREAARRIVALQGMCISGLDPGYTWASCLSHVYAVYLLSEPDILVLDSPESCSKTRPAQLMAATIPDRFRTYCVVKLNVYWSSVVFVWINKVSIGTFSFGQLLLWNGFKLVVFELRHHQFSF